MTDADKALKIIEAIHETVKRGQRVTFSDDWENHTLTLVVGNGHTHVGKMDHGTMSDLIDDTLNALTGGPGLSFEPAPGPWRYSCLTRGECECIAARLERLALLEAKVNALRSAERHRLTALAQIEKGLPFEDHAKAADQFDEGNDMLDAAIAALCEDAGEGR